MPLRELFAAVFFVSIGMLVDLSFVARHPLATLAVLGAVVATKALVAGAAVTTIGAPRHTAAIAGLGLAHVGEFSFMLLKLGRSHAVLGGDLYQMLLAVSALSMLATPALVALAPSLASRFGAVGGSTGEQPGAPVSPPLVVIVGYGANGAILARILRESSIRYRVVDADATPPEILQRAGVASPSLVVVAISDSQAVEAAVRCVRSLAPAARVVVRTCRLREVDAIERAGAERVVAEEYESAIAIYTWVLEQLHVPRNVIAAQTQVLRGEDYRLLRGDRLPAGISQAVADALASGTTDVFRLTANDAAVGRSLRDLDLRRRSGATVLAIVRGEGPTVTPPAEFELAVGDEVVLVGAHAEIEAAFTLLRGGE